MRRLLRAVALLVLLVLGASVAVAWLAFQGEALVASEPDVTPDDVRRAKRLLVRNDPRRVRSGAVRTVTLSQQDATLLAQYAATRWRSARTRVILRDGSARVQVSLATPSNPLGRWLNLEADLRDADGVPELHRLRVGRVPVPAFAADAAVRLMLSRVGSDAPLAMAREMVQRTVFSADSVRVMYTWRADAAGRVRDMLVAPDDVARLEAYHTRLAAVVTGTAAGGRLTLPQLLTPLFALAAERADGGDAAGENRAALATLALYVTGRSLGRWMRQAKTWPTIAPRRVTLAGREDLAKHFMVSAVVVAEADRTLADAVGLTKEVDDARGGSGFSFADLAADRAGTRFGELAVSSAEELQEAVGAGVTERDIMPSIAGLPEAMREAEFKARFGRVGSPAYTTMLATIDARIAALPLLR